MKTRTIFVDAGPNCPADALMADFRKILDQNKYAKNIEFSATCVEFFKDRADVVEEGSDHIRFVWDEVPEEELPVLEVKVRKQEGKFFLSYLKEFGDEPTRIDGKSSKGKNKGVDEKIVIIKRESLAPKKNEPANGKEERTL